VKNKNHGIYNTRTTYKSLQFTSFQFGDVKDSNAMGFLSVSVGHTLVLCYKNSSGDEIANVNFHI